MRRGVKKRSQGEPFKKRKDSSPGEKTKRALREKERREGNGTKNSPKVPDRTDGRVNKKKAKVHSVRSDKNGKDDEGNARRRKGGRASPPTLVKDALGTWWEREKERKKELIIPLQNTPKSTKGERIVPQKKNGK